MTSKTWGGFSLIELLIVIAIIGIISAVGLPAYRGYIETAQMSRVNAAYEYAVRATRDEFAKHDTRVAIGLNSTLPANSKEWVEIFDPGGATQAPGGGPAYIVDRSTRNKLTSSATTGAIHVFFNVKRQRVDIGRPSYAKLDAYRARITADTIDTKDWEDN